MTTGEPCSTQHISLPVSVAACSATPSSDMSQSSPSSSAPGAAPCSGTAGPASKSSAPTPAPSTTNAGAVAWMSSMWASRALVGLRPAVAWVRQPTTRRPCCEPWSSADPSGSSLSASPATSSSTHACVEGCALADTPLPVRSSWALPQWVRHTIDQDIGLLATPTRTANQCAPSMQKHPSCRRLTRLLGRLTPRAYRWLMGWPIDGSWSVPEMGRSRSARRQRGESSADQSQRES